MEKQIKERIENAIKQLNLKEDDLDIITLGNMNKICSLAKVDMLDLMKYIRFYR